MQAMTPPSARHFRSVWQLIGETSLTRILAVAMSFLSVIVVARALGPHGQGVVAAAVNWVMLLATIGCLSLGQVVVHRSSGRAVADWLPDALGGVLVLAACGVAAGWGAILVLTRWFPAVYGDIPPFVTLLGVALLPAYLWDMHAMPITSAAGRTRYYNLTMIAGRAAALFLVVGGLRYGGGVSWVMVANGLGVGLPGAATLRDLWQRAGGVRVAAATVRELAGGALRLHVHTLGTFLLLPVNVLVINYYRGAVETGLYQLGAQFFGAMTLVPTAAAIVLYGHVASHGHVEGWGMQRRVLLALTVGMSACAVVAAVLAPWVITTVAGDVYAPSAPLFQLQLLALPGLTIASVMAPQWIVRGWFVGTSLVTASAGVANLAVSLVLVPRLGARGAAWAIVTTYAILAAVNLGVAYRCERAWARRSPRPADTVPASPDGGAR